MYDWTFSLTAQQTVIVNITLICYSGHKQQHARLDILACRPTNSHSEPVFDFCYARLNMLIAPPPKKS
jgi:hypothetical protein